MTSAERMRKYRLAKKDRGEIELRLFFEKGLHETISRMADEQGISFYEVIKRAVTSKGVTSDVTSDSDFVTSDGITNGCVTSDGAVTQVSDIKAGYVTSDNDEASRVTDDQNNIYYINNIYTDSYISTEGSEVLTPWPMEEANDKSREKGTGKGRKGRAKKERPGKAHKFGEETPEYQIAERLISLIASKDPKFMRTKEINPFQWAVSVHPMLAEDGRTFEEVMALLDWIEQNDTWEISTIMGPKKLRDQFTRINIKRQGREARDKQHAEWKAQREQRRFTKAPVPTRRIESADRIRKVNEMVEKARRQRGLDAMPSSIAAALDDCAASMGTGFFEEAGDVFFLSDAAH